MTNSERWLAAAVSDLADALEANFDLNAFSARLAGDLAELLAPADVALAVADERGELHVEGATSDRAFALASVDLGKEQGPCTDSFRSGDPIRDRALDGAGNGWPQFAPIARAAGFRVAHALPLRCRAGSVGVAAVLGEGADPLTDLQVGLADALATSAAVSILQERAVRRSAEKSEQLQRALDSRIVVEQAKGMVAARLNTDVDAAFRLLRDYARGRNERLAAVCEDVVNRRLPPGALVTSRRGTGRRRDRNQVSPGAPPQ
jgi:GAF domain-containing protein